MRRSRSRSPANETETESAPRLQRSGGQRDPPTIALCSQPLPNSLLAAWRTQLALHNGAEPVWVPSTSLHPGSLVADTLAWIKAGTTAPGLCDEIAGVELWAQRRPVTSSMHLHFDCDEERGRLQHELHCPVLSCILYVNSTGGPTLVLEHKPGDVWRSTVRCHACWPHAGQILVFGGDLLHGTVGERSCAELTKSPPVERVTIILNLWRRPPLGVAAVREPEAPAPNCNVCCKDDSACAMPDVDQKRTGEAHVGEHEAWSWRKLIVGMYNRTTTISLCMPPLAVRSRCETFTARVRDAPS